MSKSSVTYNTGSENRIYFEIPHKDEADNIPLIEISNNRFQVEHKESYEIIFRGLRKYGIENCLVSKKYYEDKVNFQRSEMQSLNETKKLNLPWLFDPEMISNDDESEDGRFIAIEFDLAKIADNIYILPNKNDYLTLYELLFKWIFEHVNYFDEDYQIFVESKSVNNNFIVESEVYHMTKETKNQSVNNHSPASYLKTDVNKSVNSAEEEKLEMTYQRANTDLSNSSTKKLTNQQLNSAEKRSHVKELYESEREESQVSYNKFYLKNLDGYKKNIP